MTTIEPKVGNYYWARRIRDGQRVVVYCHGDQRNPRFSCARTHKVSPEDFELIGVCVPPRYENTTHEQDNVGA